MSTQGLMSGGGSGKITGELLFENDNNSFGSETLTFDTSKYKCYFLEYIRNTSETTIIDKIFDNIGTTITTTSGVSTVIRSFTISNNRMTINRQKYDGSDAGTDWLIPKKIYGFKIV